MNKYAVPEYVSSIDIKRVRNKLKINQKDFGLLVGCSASTIARWERTEQKITGPLVLLLMMLENNLNYVNELVIPNKKLPLRLYYMFRNRLCTVIDVDDKNQEIIVKNFTNLIAYRAFGINENPTYKDYEKLLKSRQFNETRNKIAIKNVTLPFYDRFLIIDKNEDSKVEDQFWIIIDE